MALYLKKSTLFFIVLLIAENTLASANTVTGRYLSVADKPSHEQQDLLSQVLQVRFPKDVKKIGDAMNYLLRYSGYSLVDASHQNSNLKNTLQKPLPLVDRNFGPMTLRDALVTLSGPAFTISEDTLNREINFHLKSSFSKKIHNGVSA